MKPIACILLIISFVFFISCNEAHKDDPGTPSESSVLSDGKSRLESYARSSSDLTEELYAELVSKSASLQKLEKDMNSFRQIEYDSMLQFNQYNSKSDNYYSSAENKVAGITDTVLKKEILALINKSKNQYTNMTGMHQLLLKQISKKDLTIGEHYNLMKVLLTLPVIEHYQKNNLPNTKALNSLQKPQEQILKTLDSLIPPF